jgi:hypothetical protein
MLNLRTDPTLKNTVLYFGYNFILDVGSLLLNLQGNVLNGPALFWEGKLDTLHHWIRHGNIPVMGVSQVLLNLLSEKGKDRRLSLLKGWTLIFDKELVDYTLC